MRELALHILDLVQNCITARATQIRLEIEEAVHQNRLTIIIGDNGCGMSPEILQKVTDPFYTTRTTRNVGLGIPMFKMNAELCDGDFEIVSEVNVGTTITAHFVYNHIDRPPLGDMANTIVGIVLSLEKDCDLYYKHQVNQDLFEMDTAEMREILGPEADLSDVSFLQWLQAYIQEGLSVFQGEVL